MWDWDLCVILTTTGKQVPIHSYKMPVRPGWDDYYLIRDSNGKIRSPLRPSFFEQRFEAIGENRYQRHAFVEAVKYTGDNLDEIGELFGGAVSKAGDYSEWSGYEYPSHYVELPPNTHCGHSSTVRFPLFLKEKEEYYVILDNCYHRHLHQVKKGKIFEQIYNLAV